MSIADDAAAHAAGLTNAFMDPLYGHGWTPQFTTAGDFYISAEIPMTIGQGAAKIGTGTLTFAKSTAAAPSTFTTTTLPVTLEAGSWLKVTAASITGFVATHLKRVL